MSVDVKLGDDIAGGLKLIVHQLHVLWKLRKPFQEVPRPLACNIVGEKDHLGQSADQTKEDNKIHVRISEIPVSVIQ